MEADLLREQAYWKKLHEVSRYETVEQLRNAVDRHDWLAVETQKRHAIEAARSPSRTIPENLGSVRRRPTRQVNVKLSPPDFEALKALAIRRDVPPSTLARMLVREGLVLAARRGPPPSG